MARLGEMMIFNEEKDGESERYAMIFIADLTPPPALCPYIHGSAVLKSDDKLSIKTKCQRYVMMDFDQGFPPGDPLRQFILMIFATFELIESVECIAGWPNGRACL